MNKMFSGNKYFWSENVIFINNPGHASRIFFAEDYVVKKNYFKYQC